MPRDRRERGPAEPWQSFLAELDAQLEGPADFRCIGGFIVSQHYGLGRETADLDLLSIIPKQAVDRVSAVAGRGSQLQKKHRVCIDYVQVANYPDSYESRLIRVFPLWTNVRLWALEPHDLALTKLERSSERDIRDVMYLAKAEYINQGTLLARFEAEMEPYITGRTPTWHRTTLDMWIESCWPK